MTRANLTVLVDASTLRIGGGPIIVAHELCELRVALGPDARLLLVESSTGLAVPDRARVEKVAGPSLDPASPKGFLRWIAGEAGARARALGADAFLSFTNWLPARLGVPSLLYLHNPYALEFRVTTPTEFVHRLPRYLAARAGLAAADAVIVQTAAAKETLGTWRFGPKPEQILVRPPSGEWMREREPDAAFRAKLEALRGEADCWLFYPSLRADHKNMDGLAAAMRLAGKGPLKLGLLLPSDGIAPSEVAGAVAFRAFGGLTQAQMAACYDFADAVIFPSHLETAGLGLVEALSRGRPLLASRRPFTADLCGDAALTFEPTDPADIVATIAAFWADPQRAAAATGRADAWRASRAKVAAQTWGSVFDRLCPA
jgi:glycosyltransferase involved in cell wall biosynthesis